MSNVLFMPTDELKITIDNRTNPPGLNLALSRQLPAPLVCAYLAAIIQSLCGAQLTGAVPSSNPTGNPLTNANQEKTD